MSRYLLLLTVAVAILADGSLCGRWSGRWRQVDQSAAAEKLKQLPMTCGDWEVKSLQEIEPRIVQLAGFSGYELREYKNQRNPRALPVNVLLAWGPAGPLSVHSPEICYGAAGYGMSGGSTVFTPHDTTGSPRGDFFKSTFVSQHPTSPRKLRVVWSWNKNGVWHAPNYPRWTLAGTPVLYKLYVTQEFLPGDNAADAKEANDVDAFLQDFLPQLDRALVQDS
jgi:hypothetical protein